MSTSDVTTQLMTFIDASPSPYHAVRNAATDLGQAGFTERQSSEAWDDVPQLGYVTEGGALIAWHIGENASPSTPFTLLTAHSDSPNLRIKARPDVVSAGWQQLGVEVYGGALTNSWLDRDLGISGRVVLRDGGGTQTRLVLVQRPLLRVAQLAIHLDREYVTDGINLDSQDHLSPVWALADETQNDFAQFLGDELGCDPNDILGWDVMTHDLTPSALLGRDNEFLAAPRLDNLCSTYCGLRSLIDTASEVHPTVDVLVLFDHEEIGSTSNTGADAMLLGAVLERLVLARGGTREDFHRATASSYCVSADMAHAVHPNYLDKHEPAHHVQVNHGPVIKLNANVRYASDAETSALFKLACERAGVGTQEYVHRTNLGCGSTVGPVTAARLGMAVVDVGLAQLSMHSARELCGAHDPKMMVGAMSEVLRGA
ncbi:MAG: M18 family aminopeptidase [Acidimicrobiales bacterium]